jgi:heme exporter protein B
MLVMVLGTWGLTAIGTVFGALTVNIRLREVMLPLLVYPVMIPILLGAMKLSTDLVAGQPISGDLVVWLKLLFGFDIIFTALSLVLMDTVLVG